MNKLCQTVSYNLINGSVNKLLFPLASSVFVPSRNTFILKRRYPTKLVKKHITYKRLKGADYVYDLVEDTDIRPQYDVKVILKTFVDGLGNRGDLVTVSRNTAYNKLLVTGLADYATPEAIERLKNVEEGTEKKDEFSSPFVPRTVKYLESCILNIIMSKETEWTLAPWHVRVSFRKAGIHVPEQSIQLPDKPIAGPNLDLERKEFCITVTINNKEKARVRCRVHHWSTSPGDRLPYVARPWTQAHEPLFPEQTDTIAQLPPVNFKSVEA